MSAKLPYLIDRQLTNAAAVPGMTVTFEGGVSVTCGVQNQASGSAAFHATGTNGPRIEWGCGG